MKAWTIWLAALAGVLITGVVQAQNNTNIERFERQREQLLRQSILDEVNAIPAQNRALLDYGGYLSLDYLTLKDQVGENHVLRQADVVGYAKLNIDGAHEFFVRGRATWKDFNPGDSFDGQGDDFESVLERAYYRFDLKAYLATQGKQSDVDLAITGGRQLGYWANGLVLSEVLDGVTADLNTDWVDVELLAGVTPVRTIDIDSSRPSFDDATHRGFFGLMLTKTIGSHRPFVYALFQRDFNHNQTLENGPVTTKFDYNSYYIGAGSSGNLGDRWLYGAEVVYEGGRGLSTSFDTSGGALSAVDQTHDPINAFGADFKIDYLFPDAAKTRIGFELTLASGDADRRHTTNTFGGNKSGTDDKSFNGFGLLNNGLAFAPNVSNLWMMRLGASSSPFATSPLLRDLQVGVDVFLYQKFSTDAPIDEATNDGRYLGWEPDFFVNWQIRSDVTFALRYGIFFPGDDTIIDGERRQFLFMGLTFSF